MNNYIYKLIREQFTIKDIDFNDDDTGYSNNIFNKELCNPQKVYDKILN